MQAISLLCAAALTVAASNAPAAAGNAAPDAADATVAVPPARYESAFSDYVRQRETERLDWRDANSAVAGSGGHAAHAGHGGAAPAGDQPDAHRH
jgi:hypothetical protein